MSLPNPKQFVRLVCFIWMTFTIVVFTVHAQDSIQYQGRVIKVVDGDSIHILVDKRTIKIRLAEIDTPERGQPYWRVSRKALENFVAGKEVRVIQVDIDRYHQVVGQVYVDGIWINESLVRSGYAWVYPKYAKSKALYEAEDKARKEKIGIWKLSESERIPPWEWRRIK